MAQSAGKDVTDARKWKLGAKCSMFNRQDGSWNEGTIVGSFSDNKGEWVKVQCGSEIHDVRTDDPDLRVADHEDTDIGIVTEKINELQAVARRRPDVAPMIDQTIEMSNKLRTALRNSSKSLVHWTLHYL